MQLFRIYLFNLSVTHTAHLCSGRIILQKHLKIGEVQSKINLEKYLLLLITDKAIQEQLEQVIMNWFAIIVYNTAHAAANIKLNYLLRDQGRKRKKLTIQAMTAMWIIVSLLKHKKIEHLKNLENAKWTEIGEYKITPTPLE